MSRRWRSIVACSVVLAAAALGGCGSSAGPKKVSAEAYANSLCTAAGPFEREIYAHAGALTEIASVTPAAGKATLISFLSGTVADSQRAGQAMRGAGVPNVPEGKQIAGALVAMFTRLVSSLRVAESTAETLPTNTAAAFRAAAGNLSDSIRTSVGDADSSLAGLKSPALERAAELSPDCHSLG